MNGLTLKKRLQMKLPNWLLPIIASVIVMLVSTDVGWTWNLSEKANSALAQCDRLNESLIDHKLYDNAAYSHVEKRLDKIQEQLEKMNDKLDKIRDLK